MRLAICPGVLRLMLVFGAFGWLAATPAGAAGASETWQVVLAAGDDAEPVFDNATHEMNRRLAAAGIPASNIHRLSASATELATGAETRHRRSSVAADRRPAGPAGGPVPDLFDLARRARQRCMARPFEPGSDSGRARPRVVAGLRRGAHRRDRLGLLQRQLCNRKDGEIQSHCPDGRPRGQAILWLSAPPHLQLL